MDVGMMMIYSNYGWDDCPDAQVWDEELRLAALAADLAWRRPDVTAHAVLDGYAMFTPAERDELLAALQEKAGLSQEKSDALSELWEERSAKVDELFSAARSGDRDFMEVRREVRGLMEGSEEQIKALLGDEAYAVYEEERGERGFRGGPPRP